MDVLGNMTAEAMDEKAAAMSRGGFAAVVEIVTYMRGESHLTIASGRAAIRDHSRGGESRFVVRQWRDGRPIPTPGRRGTGRPLVDLAASQAPEGLPF
jgi:hypothetical protein